MCLAWSLRFAAVDIPMAPDPRAYSAASWNWSGCHAPTGPTWSPFCPVSTVAPGRYCVHLLIRDGPIYIFTVPCPALRTWEASKFFSPLLTQLAIATNEQSAGVFWLLAAPIYFLQRIKSRCLQQHLARHCGTSSSGCRLITSPTIPTVALAQVGSVLFWFNILRSPNCESRRAGPAEGWRPPSNALDMSIDHNQPQYSNIW